MLLQSWRSAASSEEKNVTSLLKQNPESWCEVKRDDLPIHGVILGKFKKKKKRRCGEVAFS